jgi:glycosyltransferase domain-containing protein
MSIDNNLTFLLTIKDRQKFTFRWLKYANKISFPFKVLIADGGKDHDVENKLSNYENFPNVNYEYIRCPYDQTYVEYYSKLDSLISKVKTPYLVLGDDDDFFLPEGLRSCVNFLDSNPDYISCGGRLSTFFIHPDCGKTYGDEVEFILHPPTNSMDSNTAVERVEKHFQSYQATWYDVHRTEISQKIYNSLCVFNPRDLLLAEAFATHHTVACGKVKRLPNLMLLRQLNILNSSNTYENKMKGNYFDRIFLETWSQDFNNFIDSITEVVVKEDGISFEIIRPKFVKAYQYFIAPKLFLDFDKDSLSRNLVMLGINTRKSFFSKFGQVIHGLNYRNPVRKILRKLYHKFQDIFDKDLHRPRPIEKSSPFYEEVRPILDFLTAEDKGL